MSKMLLSAFTDAVFAAEQEKTGIGRGYLTSGGVEYSSYLDNASWSAMVQAMRADHFSQYDSGKGGELLEKKGAPPKMASLISSSRMIYLLSKEIEGFTFEAKRSTVVGGVANLDGYLRREGEVFYVEAKRREPYDHPAIQKIKVNYRPVYEWLRDRMDTVFECVMEDRGNEEMNVVFACRGRITTSFDIKQMVCHLLGIAAYHLRQEQVPGAVNFLYLLFDPSDLTIDPQYADEILRIHQETVQAARRYHFEQMFGHIVDYLVACHGFPNDNAQTLKEVFRFRLCDQITYHKYI